MYAKIAAALLFAAGASGQATFWPCSANTGNFCYGGVVEGFTVGPFLAPKPYNATTAKDLWTCDGLAASAVACGCSGQPPNGCSFPPVYTETTNPTFDCYDPTGPPYAYCAESIDSTGHLVNWANPVYKYPELKDACLGNVRKPVCCYDYEDDNKGGCYPAKGF